MGAWIERNDLPERDVMIAEVAPHTGAWIEMSERAPKRQRSKQVCFSTTCHTSHGAWIEILHC